MDDAQSLYPLEIVLEGTPRSLQASNKSKEKWKAEVASSGRIRQQATYELGFLDNRALAVTIYYFPNAPMAGDVDNIVKPILDGLIAVAYLDDKVVERVTTQKFEPDTDWEIVSPSEQLAIALDASPPVVYILVDDSLSWRTVG